MQPPHTTKSSQPSRSIAMALAFVVLLLRLAAPYLHNHAELPVAAPHAALHQNGCPSCDADATLALADLAPVALPVSPFLYTLLPTESPITENQSLATRLNVGRAPPAL